MRGSIVIIFIIYSYNFVHAGVGGQLAADCAQDSAGEEGTQRQPGQLPLLRQPRGRDCGGDPAVSCRRLRGAHAASRVQR